MKINFKLIQVYYDYNETYIALILNNIKIPTFN